MSEKKITYMQTKKIQERLDQLKYALMQKLNISKFTKDKEQQYVDILKTNMNNFFTFEMGLPEDLDYEIRLNEEKQEFDIFVNEKYVL